MTDYQVLDAFILKSPRSDLSLITSCEIAASFPLQLRDFKPEFIYENIVWDTVRGVNKGEERLCGCSSYIRYV